MASLPTYIPKNSEHIDKVTYDPNTKRIHIRFLNKFNKNAKPRVYTYDGVPPNVFEDMKNHPSAGQYYHAVIKKHYKLV